MANSNRNAANCIGCFSEVCIEVSDLVLINFIYTRVAVSLGIDYVFLQKLLVESLSSSRLSRVQPSILEQIVFKLLFDLFILLVGNKWVTTHVRINNEGSKLIINFRVNFVTNDCQQVKTRQDWIGKVDIVIKVVLWLVNTTNRICRRNDGAARLKRSDNTCL